MNGYPLASPADAIRIYKNITKRANTGRDFKLELEVERDSETRTLTYKIVR